MTPKVPRLVEAGTPKVPRPVGAGSFFWGGVCVRESHEGSYLGGGTLYFPWVSGICAPLSGFLAIM